MLWYPEAIRCSSLQEMTLCAVRPCCSLVESIICNLRIDKATCGRPITCFQIASRTHTSIGDHDTSYCQCRCWEECMSGSFRLQQLPRFLCHQSTDARASVSLRCCGADLPPAHALRLEVFHIVLKASHGVSVQAFANEAKEDTPAPVVGYHSIRNSDVT